MGFSPQQVDQMSMWQFYAALNGHIELNTPKSKEKLSEDELDDLADWIEMGFSNSRQFTTPVYLWDENGPVLDKVVTFEL